MGNAFAIRATNVLSAISIPVMVMILIVATIHTFAFLIAHSETIAVTLINSLCRFGAALNGM